MPNIWLKRDTKSLPLVPVKDVVVFPNVVIPFVAANRVTVAAVEESIRSYDSQLFIDLLRSEIKDPKEIDVYTIGTICKVVQRVPMPDGSLRLLLSGEHVCRLESIRFEKDFAAAELSPIEMEIGQDKLIQASIRAVKRAFLQYSELNRKISPEALLGIETAHDATRTSNLICHAIIAKPEHKQALLERQNLLTRLEELLTFLESEIEIMTIQKRITQKVKTKIDKNQKEYFMQEQIKEMNRELGKDQEENEIADLERRIQARSPSDEVMERAKRELNRLAKLQSLSPEAGVLRSYCEWLADLPWSERSQDSRDIEKARSILDDGHYGMRKVKERVLEFIAVRQLKEDAKGPILCFVGPPGTGKTSLASSLARALERRYVRVSLGGLRDEAEIRGHRRTYVGALPGKIIQGMRKAGSLNPVFLLDEIDKMNSDFRGDPASALLEVLDPEQNKNFQDHYLELNYDLSSVMFIATANSLHSIPYPLLDRMEIIEVPGYSEWEKLEIAKKYIIPRQQEENGLGSTHITFPDNLILDLIRSWTMESGVRALEREIAHLMRHLANESLQRSNIKSSKAQALNDQRYLITRAKLEKHLGKKRFEDREFLESPGIGCAIGLAWTEAGGTVLPVETALLPGSGELILTGNLGEVMKESARIALSYLRSGQIRIPERWIELEKKAIHIHAPQGAIPKDGPSAGIALVASLLSRLSGLALLPNFTMTGEISLSGRVLPIGGVKEKLLAAHRFGLKNVVLPFGNSQDLDDVPKEVGRTLNLNFVKTVDEALTLLFPAELFKLTKNKYNATSLGSDSIAGQMDKKKQRPT